MQNRVYHTGQMVIQQGHLLNVLVTAPAKHRGLNATLQGQLCATTREVVLLGGLRCRRRVSRDDRDPQPAGRNLHAGSPVEVAVCLMHHPP